MIDWRRHLIGDLPASPLPAAGHGWVAGGPTRVRLARAGALLAAAIGSFLRDVAAR